MARDVRAGEMVDGTVADIFHVLQVGSRQARKVELALEEGAEAKHMVLELHHATSDFYGVLCTRSVFRKVEVELEDAFCV